jgi:two-component system, OmpR family, response regulator VicR
LRIVDFGLRNVVIVILWENGLGGLGRFTRIFLSLGSKIQLKIKKSVYNPPNPPNPFSHCITIVSQPYHNHITTFHNPKSTIRNRTNLAQSLTQFKHPKSMKILVIDDQPMILKTLHHRLEKAGFDIAAAIDGKQAMSLFDSEKPDLVIVDLLLPFAGGFEILNFIREQRKSQIPVMVLSTIGLEKTIVEAFALGADDYITKPFRPSEIVARVKRKFGIKD